MYVCHLDLRLVTIFCGGQDQINRRAGFFSIYDTLISNQFNEVALTFTSFKY